MEVYYINGPVIKARGGGFAISEMVYIGGKPGEVTAVTADTATIQLYENPDGLKIGTPVQKTGKPISITMQPGIIGGIFNGIMQPLAPKPLKPVPIHITAQPGQHLTQGETYATVQENPTFTYKATVPPHISGTVTEAKPSCTYSPTEPIITLNGNINLSLAQTWAIRTPRPVLRRLPLTTPLITGQRVIDSLFPIAKGDICAIPGGFGTGKTILQHQIAKHCDAQVIIYIGCGERGNEMAEALESFATLTDPTTGNPLLNRTVLIANTSDMPVAAREASIFSGITLAEFYRDMGYHVAVMADSTSRWAEALREISARRMEIPAEEGYPAYLSSRLTSFYSRAGAVTTLGNTTGSITIIGAVSPQSGDFSEPVTTQTKRITSAYWALDKKLAYARHFPAINIHNSYSTSTQCLPPHALALREKTLQILHQEAALQESIQLLGTESLTPAQHRLLQTAAQINRKFLRQNAYDPADTYTPLQQQFEILEKLCL